MSYRFLIKPRALSDIREAYEWYEEQSAGLGGAFIRAVDASLQNISEYPESSPVVIEKVRRAILRRFPYGVFYLFEEDTITILALYHTSRDPKGWRGMV